MVMSIKWKIGVNKSNARNESKLNTRKMIPKIVNRGIHVFTTRKDAESLSLSFLCDRVIIPVQCKNKDLIAVDFGEEVYTQVTISKNAMRKALKP